VTYSGAADDPATILQGYATLSRIESTAGAKPPSAGVKDDQSGTVTITPTVTPPLPGDANGDRKVDFSDLLILAQNYGKTGQSFATGDFNGDGVVGFPDLLILAQNYGRTSTVASLAETLLRTKTGLRR
jgi:hypothetical protein